VVVTARVFSRIDSQPLYGDDAGHTAVVQDIDGAPATQLYDGAFHPQGRRALFVFAEMRHHLIPIEIDRHASMVT
jgi:hypothetical protein